MRAFTVVLTAAALTAACGGGDVHPAPESDSAQQSAPSAAPSQQATAPPTAPSAGGGSDSFAPLTSRGTRPREAAPAGDATGPNVVAQGLSFTLPDDWGRQPPSNNMRIAQATIPGEAGPGELAVFFFGAGQGGAVEANLQRWAGQIEGGAPQRETFTGASGLQITWIDATGTIVPTGMGMGPTEPVPGSRLFGAVIEGQGGPWFFKATGPEATLSAQRDAFVAMLRDASLQ